MIHEILRSTFIDSEVASLQLGSDIDETIFNDMLLVESESVKVFINYSDLDTTKLYTKPIKMSDTLYIADIVYSDGEWSVSHNKKLPSVLYDIDKYIEVVSTSDIKLILDFLLETYERVLTILNEGSNIRLVDSRDTRDYVRVVYDPRKVARYLKSKGILETGKLSRSEQIRNMTDDELIQFLVDRGVDVSDIVKDKNPPKSEVKSTESSFLMKAGAAKGLGYAVRKLLDAMGVRFF